MKSGTLYNRFVQSYPDTGYPSLPSRWSTAGPRTIRRLTPRQQDLPYSLFDLRPLGPLLGAEISGVDLRVPLASAVRSEVERALLEWKVIFFRNQHLTPEQHKAFAQLWGEVEENSFFGNGKSGDIARFPTDDRRIGRHNIWNTDATWRGNPAMGCVLRMAESIPIGAGDTIWADAGAAYDNLPEDIRLFIQPLDAVHDFMPGTVRSFPADELKECRAQFPPVVHPVVRTNPATFRKTLFVNAAWTTHIPALPLPKSEELLRFLFAQALIPELQVRWSWRAGDVALWDNMATWHYAISGYGPRAGVAERFFIAGGVPFGDQDTPGQARSGYVHHVCLEDNVLATSLHPAREYSRISLTQIAPPLAHAAVLGSNVTLCSTRRPLISLRVPWGVELPEHWTRCPECLSVIA